MYIAPFSCISIFSLLEHKGGLWNQWARFPNHLKHTDRLKHHMCVHVAGIFKTS